MAPARHALPGLALAALVAGCNAPEPPGSTGGTNQGPGACGRGIVVVSTDYQSTNVSLLGVDGKVLTKSFISSAGDAKLSAKLSGDVMVPTMRMDGADIVIVQRRPVGVLTWLDVKTAKVRGQLALGTTNPHDYLGLGADKAYVSRYDVDPNGGVGSDVAIVDPTTRQITGKIELGSALSGIDSSFLPTPWRLANVGGKVVVSLIAETKSHLDAVPSRVVAVDPKTDALGDVLVLDGLYECTGLAPSPDGKRFAMSCSGRFDASMNPIAAESGLVVVDAAGALKEVARIPAQNGAPYGFGVAWSSAHTLVANTFGAKSADGLSVVRKDSVVQVDLDTLAVTTLFESKTEAFVLGDVRCATDCGQCFATDMEQGVVHHFMIGSDSTAKPESSIVVDTTIGLSPWMLGGF